MSAATEVVVVAMPHMGVSVEEGTVIEWLKGVGDEVEAEEAICAIATDKVDTEVVAPVGGVIARIVAEEGAVVAVGEPIAEIGSPDATPRVPDPASAGESDTPTSGAASAPAEPAPVAPPKAESPRVRDSGLAARAAAGRDEFGRFDPRAAAEAVLSFVAVTGDGGSSGAALASPVARRMAAQHGVDLSALQGSGRGGRVRKSDVEAAIAGGRNGGNGGGGSPAVATPAPARPAPGAEGLPPGYEGVPHEVVETTRVRKLIAEHMVRSRQTAAHMTTEVDVDLSRVVRARAETNATRIAAGEPKLSYLPYIARAACLALGEHPELNATFLGEHTIHWRRVNLGIAVDTPEGLLVPVIPACERLDLPAIAAAIADLAERARTRKLKPDDLIGGTFTLSNPGSVGAVSAPAIINQPQVAILGVPTIARKPWVISDDEGQESIAIRPILRLAVTFDHRAVDGANATRFAVAIKDRLEAFA